jgi:hypothetical protein
MDPDPIEPSEFCCPLPITLRGERENEFESSNLLLAELEPEKESIVWASNRFEEFSLLVPEKALESELFMFEEVNTLVSFS